MPPPSGGGVFTEIFRASVSQEWSTALIKGHNIRLLVVGAIAGHWTYANPWELSKIALTMPCARVSSHLLSANCCGKTRFDQGRRPDWSCLISSKAGTIPIGDILLSTTCRLWLTKGCMLSPPESSSRKPSTKSGELHIHIDSTLSI